MSNASHSDAQYQKMIFTPIHKLIPPLAVPTIISMLVTAFYNAADTYFVAKLGTQAAAAVGLVFSLMSLLQTLGFTMGIGSGSQISRLLGRKENDKADEVVVSAVVMALVAGIVLGILGLAFNRPLMMLLGAKETTISMAMNYAKYILIFSPFVLCSYVLNNNLRAEGKATFSMIGITTGVVLNIVLDPLLIFAFNMGIAGAALATGISQFVSCAILFSHYVRKLTVIRFRLSSISKAVHTYTYIIQCGMPSFCRQGLSTISMVILNSVAGSMGDEPLAAISIVSKVVFILGAVVVGFGHGFQPVAGYNYGAKRYDRVRTAILFSLGVTMGTMLIASILAVIASPAIIGCFSEDVEVIRIGTKCMRAQCIVFFIAPITIITNMALQAIGKTAAASVTSSLRQGVCLIPLVLILPRMIGVDGVAYAQAAADLLAGIIMTPVCITLIVKLTQKQKSEGIAHGME